MENFIVFNSAPTKAVHHRKQSGDIFSKVKVTRNVLLLLFHLAGALQN